jgi:hypothetical protein
MTIAQQTAIVRSFNRSYTQRIEALEESFLGMGMPLSHERLLFEIGRPPARSTGCGCGWGSTQATSAGSCGGWNPKGWWR